MAGGCIELSGIIEIQEDRENYCLCKLKKKIKRLLNKRTMNKEKVRRLPIAFDGGSRSRMGHPLCFIIAWSTGGKVNSNDSITNSTRKSILYI